MSRRKKPFTRLVEDCRHTIGPCCEACVHIKYHAGARVWVTPIVAKIAIERGQAKKIKPRKSKAKKK